MQHQRVESPARLQGLDAARRFFAGSFTTRDRAQEALLVAHLDGKTNCVHLARYEGDGQSVPMPVRAIIHDAVTHGTQGLVLAHTHPSGDATPSADDCRATRRLALAIEAIDVALVDHLIFADDQCTSFRRLGLL